MSWFDDLTGRKEQTQQQPPVADPNKAVLDRLEAISTRLDAYDSRFAALQTQQTRQVLDENQGGDAPVLNLEGLPDPVFEPEAWQKAFAERNAAYTASVVAQTREADRAALQEEQAFARRAEGVWQQFKTKHADWAGNEAAVRFAAGEVAAVHANRGEDVAAYIFGNTEAYSQEVIKYLQDSGFQPKGNPNPEPASDRTQGLLGNPYPVPGPSGTEQPGDMIKDLQEVQRSMRIY